MSSKIERRVPRFRLLTNRGIGNILFKAGFRQDEISLALKHVSKDCHCSPWMAVPGKFFQYLDEDVGDKEKDDDLLTDHCEEACIIAFIVAPSYGSTGKLVKSIADSLMLMQERLSELDHDYGVDVEKWSNAGNQSTVYVGKNNAHMYCVREQAEIVHLPTVIIYEKTGRTSTGASTQSTVVEQIAVICLFGPESTVNRVVKQLSPLH